MISIQREPVSAVSSDINFPMKGRRGMKDWARSSEDKLFIPREVLSLASAGTARAPPGPRVSAWVCTPGAVHTRVSVQLKEVACGWACTCVSVRLWVCVAFVAGTSGSVRERAGGVLPALGSAGPGACTRAGGARGLAPVRGAAPWACPCPCLLAGCTCAARAPRACAGRWLRAAPLPSPLPAELDESSHFVIGAVLYRTLGLILPPPR